jgi:hypothetical protein
MEECETTGKKRTAYDTEKAVAVAHAEQDQQFRFPHFDISETEWFANTLATDTEQGPCGWCYRHRFTGRPALVLLKQGSHYTVYFQELGEKGVLVLGLTTPVDEAYEEVPEQMREIAQTYFEKLGKVEGECDEAYQREEEAFLRQIDPSLPLPPSPMAQPVTERVIVKAKRVAGGST